MKQMTDTISLRLNENDSQLLERMQKPMAFH